MTMPPPVVVGAGPAGVRAVEQLVRAGLRPVWLEEAADGGGRIYQKPPSGFARDHRALYGADAAKARALHDALEALKPRTDWRPGTLVWNIRPRDGGLLDTLRDGTTHEAVPYAGLILCTGAMDRVVPIPGWTLPGVTSLGGSQVSLKSQGLAIGRRVVFLGTGPLLLLVAYQYAKAGAEVAAVLDTSAFATKARAAPGLLWNTPTFLRGLRYLAGLRARRIPLHEGITPLAIEGGEDGVTAVAWRDARGAEHRTACDAAAMGWGLKPEAQLADLAAIPFSFDPVQHNWVPRKDAAGRTPVEGVYLAGDGASIGGAGVAELTGARAALALLQDRGLPADGALAARLDRRLRAEARFRHALERAFPFPAALAGGMADTTILCRCEAVTAGEFRAALRDTAATGAAREVNRAKAFSRVGMGRCQGRLCGAAAAEILAAEQGCGIEAAGRLRGQPPVKPLPMPLLTTPAAAALKADVLVLGGGGAGCSAALHLAQRGAKALLLERGVVGSQAAGVNYGGVRQQGRHPAELPLARRAREIWARLPELVGTDAEFDPCGHLKLARSEAEEAELLRWNAMAAEHGLQCRMIGRNAIRADHPYFGDHVVAGSLLPEDGCANPRLLAPAFARAAREAGATILEHHEVTGMAHDGRDFVLEANGTEFRAPVLLNTAGYWGREVAAAYGEDVPCAPLYPNMLVTEPLPWFLPHSLGVVGGDTYMRQISRGNVIFGGGRGEGDPAIPISRPRPDSAFGAMERAVKLIPRLDGAMIIRSWTGIDGQMPDVLPVIGPSRTRPGLIHAFGFSGHGFALGPAVGAVLAELVLDGRTGTPLEGFDIDRFTGQDAPPADHWHTRV